MKKKWVTVLIIAGITILTLVMSGMIIGVVFEDKIKEIAVRELNERLATEVKITGDINFSVLANFPSASLTFNGVEIKETLPAKQDLLNCTQVILLFNIWDLFNSNYSVKKIIAESGQISIHVDEEGNNNYDIFKSSGGNSDFSLKIEEALLSNITIVFDDDRADQHYKFFTGSSTLNGDFSSDNFLLSFNADLLANQLSVDSIDYLPNRKAQIDGKLRVDLKKSMYSFEDSKVSIENNSFLVSGSVLNTEDGNQLDMKISSYELRIEEIAELLPQPYSNYLSHFKSNGNIQFDCDIKGLASGRTNPQVTVRFGIANGRFSHDQMKKSFEKVNLKGIFSNGSQANLSTSTLELSAMSFLFDGNPVTGTLQIVNLVHPFLKLNLDGTLSLQTVSPLINNEKIKALEGIVEFRQFYFNGPVNHLNASGLTKIEAGGSFSLKDVLVNTGGAIYDHIAGTFDINNNRISIRQFSFKAKDSDLRFEGTINNFIPYLINEVSDTLPNNQKIGLDVRLVSKNLAWEDLVGEASSEEGKSAVSYYSIPPLFYQLAGLVTGNIQNFGYKKFNATEIHGSILFLGNAIFFNDFGLKAEKGQAQANGKLDITNVLKNRLDLTAKLNNLDISQLFLEFNDFGQTSLTHKHLKGSVTADVALQATWDKQVFNRDKLYAVADVVVENGELNNFDPMMALAKFVRISELKNIRFSRMQNQVEIKNQKVYIPTMQIFTNALNVQLSGSHSFENIIDYKVQLNLLKLLTSKFQRTSLEPGSTDQSTEGFLNLYLLMTGPATDPDIRYDKQAVKQKIASDLKNEKNELKTILKKEFDKQEEQPQEIKDWKSTDEIQYMEFEEDTLMASDNENEKSNSLTRENQKKELNNFKDIFKPKSQPRK